MRTTKFFRAVQAEWIKKKGSFAAWLVIVGGLFIPLINTLTYLFYPDKLAILHQTPSNFWDSIFLKSWSMMSIVFLPMGIVLATSLFCQLEFKNNAWKQVHTAPIGYSSVYFAKLIVVLAMMAQLFILFNVGIYLSLAIPSLVYGHPFTSYNFNYSNFLIDNLNYFLACIPMVLLQYSLGLVFRNFLVSIGFGLALVVGGMAALSWKLNYLIQSLHPALQFLTNSQTTPLPFNVLHWSAFYSILFLLSGYIVYFLKPQKG